MALPITLSDAGAHMAAVSDSRMVSWNLACRDRLLMRIVAILVAALVGNLMGDRVRDALDPRLRNLR